MAGWQRSSSVWRMNDANDHAPLAIELVRRWISVFNDRAFEARRDLATEAYVEHAIAPFGRVEAGLVNGPEHLREVAEWLLAPFPISACRRSRSLVRAARSSPGFSAKGQFADDSTA